MKLKLLSTVAIFATVTNAVLAQKDDHVPKPTLADAQTVVQTISNDKAKLQAYCELGKLEDQMEKAEEANDAKTVEALFVKSDALAQQIGSEYLKIVDGLADVDPSPPKGRSSLPCSMPSTKSANRRQHP
jgi:hypothetical protein